MVPEQTDLCCPLVSIITVCLNSVKTLECTIQSVRGQTYRNIEYLIIDGGSTDGTIDIIKKYEDCIAYWVSEPDQGLYDAMNKGIKRAHGQLVGIINSDDYYERDAVEKVVNEFRQDKEAGVFCGEVIFWWDQSDNPVRWRKRMAGLGTFYQEIVHQGMFVKKEVYQRFLYDLRYWLESDMDFVYRLYFNGVKFHLFSDVVATFRIGGLSRSFLALVDDFRIHNRYFGGRFFLKNIFLFGNRTVKWCIKRFIFQGNFNHPFLRWYRRKFRRSPDLFLDSASGL